MTSLPRRFFADVRALAASPLALVATLVFGAAVLSTVVLFPRVEAASTSEPATAGTETEVQGPAVTASQQTELERWYESQPRENVPVEGGGATVVIVKFNDYQCPPCKMTYEQYRPIRTKYAASAPGKVQFVTKDFPLESECNATIPNGGPHPTACEAAVAVRLAREKNKAEAIEEWLFANQENVTLPGLKGALTQLAGVTDFDARYRATLEQVKADSALGGLLNVKSTPTFFINGVRVVGGLAPQFLDAIIAYELRKTAK